MDQDQAQELVLEALAGVTEMSPYRLAKVASELVGYEVIPQVVYSYVRQGFIEASVNNLGHKSVSVTEAERWLTKYVSRNFGKK